MNNFNESNELDNDTFNKLTQEEQQRVLDAERRYQEERDRQNTQDNTGNSGDTGNDDHYSWLR
jgi:hypothetical protein